MSFMLMMVVMCVAVGLLCPPKTSRVIGSLFLGIVGVVIVFYMTHLVS